jgi:hypothetical protein
MSSLPVAAQPGRAAPRLSLVVVILALVVAGLAGAALGAVIAANRTAAAVPPVATTPSVKHHSATPPVTATSRLVEYRQIVANVAAAEQRHDYAAKARYASQLDEMMTPQMIGAIYQERARLLAGLEVSVERRDTHSRALIARQIRSLCADTAKAQLDFCN